MSDDGLKLCGGKHGCGKFKEKSAFGIKLASKDGLAFLCKTCVVSYARERRLKAEVKTAEAAARQKYRSKPEVKSNIKNQRAEYRAKLENREAQAKYMAEWRARPEVKVAQAEYRARPEVKAAALASAATPERKASRVEISAKYNAKPEVKAATAKRLKSYLSTPEGKALAAQRRARRRAWRSTNKHEPYDFAKICREWKWVCFMCGRKIDTSLRWPDPMSLSEGHLIALAKGGSDTADNVAPQHLNCNGRQGTRPWYEVSYMMG
jgi:hypothetical protein